MSLINKLYKIGDILEEKEIKQIIRNKTNNEIDYNYININFEIDKNKIKKISVNEKSISNERMFFTDKIGGSGSGIYYFYPNLVIQKEKLGKKIIQLNNTIEKIILKNCSDNNRKYCELIISEFKNIKEYLRIAENKILIEIKEKEIRNLKNNKNINKESNKIQKLKKEIEKAIDKIKETEKYNKNIENVCYYVCKQPKEDYIMWYSINGKTFLELMPEVWENWKKNVVIPNDSRNEIYDVFNNKKSEMGYRTEVKVYSYDQYDNNLNYRLNFNVPLSKESATKIRFAWMYILEYLVFYYKGLEYIIIPNVLSDNNEILSKVLKRLRRANKKTSEKRTTLKELRLSEKKIEKDIKILKEKEKKEKREKEFKEIINKINAIDTGYITEFKEQLDTLDNLKNSVTLDYIFINLNRTDKSFEIKGTLEDVIPSNVSNTVNLMEELNISDVITPYLKKEMLKKYIFLQDYFNRKELLITITNTKAKNKIIKERIALARLLLTTEKIYMDDLINRFHKNREFNYKGEKRITDDGIKEWIEYSDKFIKNEKVILKFFTKLNKIRR